MYTTGGMAKRLAPAMAVGAIALVCAWLVRAQLSAADQDLLWQHRNLGKAFYENPTTQAQAVDEFRKALDLAPNSVRERVNYALALLRGGDAKTGIAELEKVQKQDAKLPHTWFNLGIAYKREGDYDRAFTQFQQMATLVPNDPISHYQLGALYKSRNDAAAAIAQFEKARDLDPRLAAPHFQLYGMYRQQGRQADAAKELAAFQEMKKAQEGAASAEDMEWNAYAEIYDPIDAPPSLPLAPPVYRTERIASDFDQNSAGGAALALDGGVRPSVIAWSAGRVSLFRNGRTALADSGLGGLRDVVYIAPGDFDNDGLPDLCVITKQGASLYRNVKGRFQKQADLARGSFRKSVWMDFDHDYDEDLFLIGDDSRLLRNNGEAGFGDETRRFPFVAGRALDAVPFDLEPDTPGFDLVVSYQDRPGALYRDRLGGNYQAVTLDALPAGAKSLAGADTNHDGRTDVEAAGLTLLNRPEGFQRAPGGPKPVQPSVFADFDGDGRLARAWISKDGSLNLDRNTASDYGNWVEIALNGVKNPRIPLNAKVEVKAGTSYEKAAYGGIPLVFRLGDRQRIDTVRITWPNGMMQNETKQPVNQVIAVKEAPRLAGSCPMVFTWNGSRFEFITDVLGVAPLGASSGDGAYFPVDHDEYVSIRGESMKAVDGQYRVRLTEELREVSYIDQIKLIALDHPASVDIVTNEKFKSPPFPEFRLFGAERKIHPVSARDSRGADVRSALLERDNAYPDSFRREANGVAELHHLDLDFGNAARDNRAALILNGWVDWADGSTFMAATQSRHDLIFPYLQVKDAAGNWKTVAQDMGMPSGKPKQMAVDLAGKFLSSSREVRIVTNLCVYWDEAYLVESDAAPVNRMTAVPMAAADFQYRGFSRAVIDPRRKQPERFDYQHVSLTSMWNPTPGNYTRYGDVANLLGAPDDRMVIMGSGDEIRMRFAAGGLPPLPSGWTRDFLLLVEGWAKDADANTAFSQTVLPLPFHGMSSYPYPAGEHYPDDPVHDRYIREYLTRPALRLIRPLVSSSQSSVISHQ